MTARFVSLRSDTLCAGSCDFAGRVQVESRGAADDLSLLGPLVGPSSGPSRVVRKEIDHLLKLAPEI